MPKAKALIIGLVVGFAMVVAIVAYADQRSFQQAITATFEQLQKHEAAFEDKAAPARKKIDDLLRALDDLDQQRALIAASSLSDDEKVTRLAEIDAQVMQDGAAYANEAANLLSGSEALVAGNLAALQELDRNLRATKGGVGDSAALNKKIADETLTGRRLVQQIEALKKRAGSNPVLRHHLPSLINSASVIDATITRQKKLIEANRAAGIDDKTGRVAGGIGEAIDDLLDMHVALTAAKAEIGEMSEELKLALATRTVDAARQVVNRAVPGLSTPGSGSIVPGFDKMMDRLRGLNENGLSARSRSPGVAEAPIPSVPTFNNF